MAGLRKTITQSSSVLVNVSVAIQGPFRVIPSRVVRRIFLIVELNVSSILEVRKILRKNHDHSKISEALAALNEKEPCSLTKALDEFPYYIWNQGTTVVSCYVGECLGAIGSKYIGNWRIRVCRYFIDPMKTNMKLQIHMNGHQVPGFKHPGIRYQQLLALVICCILWTKTPRHSLI